MQYGGLYGDGRRQNIVDLEVVDHQCQSRKLDAYPDCSDCIESDPSQENVHSLVFSHGQSGVSKICSITLRATSQGIFASLLQETETVDANYRRSVS